MKLPLTEAEEFYIAVAVNPETKAQVVHEMSIHLFESLRDRGENWEWLVEYLYTFYQHGKEEIEP